jgi:hypothetical protein
VPKSDLSKQVLTLSQPTSAQNTSTKTNIEGSSCDTCRYCNCSMLPSLGCFQFRCSVVRLGTCMPPIFAAKTRTTITALRRSINPNHRRTHPDSLSSSCCDNVTSNSTLWGSPELFALGPTGNLARVHRSGKAFCCGSVNECSHTDISDSLLLPHLHFTAPYSFHPESVYCEAIRVGKREAQYWNIKYLDGLLHMARKTPC